MLKFVRQRNYEQVWQLIYHSRRGFTHTSNAAPKSAPDPGISEISSRTNAYVKHLMRLRGDNSYRQEMQRTVLHGAEPIEELFHQGGGLHINVLILNENAERPRGIIADKVITVKNYVYEKMAGVESSRGDEVAAEVRLPQRADFKGIEWKHMGLRRLLVIENVRDPGNLGTLLRSAVAFGWDGAFIIPPACDPFNDKALRSARGAPLSLPIAYGSWDDLMEISDMHKLKKLAAQLPLVGEKQKKIEEIIQMNKRKKSKAQSKINLIQRNQQKNPVMKV
eukprot:TRINITY_DN62256_c0_g1_i7.p1 TRINITY_DN62256_c0_g1~~TRINITY_DN62256_c0_g1_i7.p1  ORF type:complete len:279 (-),score=35.01 TRINITY_DN62256_c0_g1_i7:1-837(-)